MFQGPEYNHLYGKGCWYCPWEAPVVRLSNTRMCFSCLVRAFPEWADDQVAGWLLQQAERAANFTKPAPESGYQLTLEMES